MHLKLLTSAVGLNHCRPHGSGLFASALGTLGALGVLTLVLATGSPASAVPPSFPDVPAGNPYYSAITDLASRDIIGGYPDGRFGPGEPVTRQQFAKMIILAAAYPVSEADVCPFLDVTIGDTSTLFPDNYVAVCAAQGITTGKTTTVFDPYSSISRLQAVSMVTRAVDDLHPGLLSAPPSGWTGEPKWTGDPIHGTNAARAEHGGLLAGLALSTLDPAGGMSRGEVAQVLSNMVVKLTEASQPPSATLSLWMASGAGTVILSPEGPTHPRGDPVTLTAKPAAGYKFAGWSGDVEGLMNPLVVTMDSDKSVSALFTPIAPAFESLGGPITSAPAACSRGGLLDVFARGAAGSLVHQWWDGTAWSGWEELGGSIKPGSDPAVVSWDSGRLEVFVRGVDDALWHVGWDGVRWSDWESLAGSLAADPAAIGRTAADGHEWLDVFIVGPDHQLWRRTFDGAAWGAWALDGETGPTPETGLSPTAVSWGGSRIDLLLHGTDGALWHSYLPDGGEWAPWETLGPGATSDVAASTWWSWAEGRLDLFTRGPDNGLWHRSLVSGLWSGWENLRLGVIASDPATVSSTAERIDVFVRGTDNTLWHKALNGWGWVP